MNLYGYEFQRESDIKHYGVLGMKWGVRRYQNKDGSLTDAGRKRLKKQIAKEEEKRLNARRNAPNTKVTSDLYAQHNYNLKWLKNDLFKHVLSKTDEYKAYRKAYDDAEDYEMKLIDRLKDKGLFGDDLEEAVLSDKKLDSLWSKVTNAQNAYDKKIYEVYTQNQDSLFKAKMMDLNMDTKWFDVYKEYFYEKNKDYNTPLRYL